MQALYEGTNFPPPSLEDLANQAGGRRLLAAQRDSRQLRGGYASGYNSAVTNRNPGGTLAT